VRKTAAKSEAVHSHTVLPISAGRRNAAVARGAAGDVDRTV